MRLDQNERSLMNNNVAESPNLARFHSLPIASNEPVCFAKRRHKLQKTDICHRRISNETAYFDILKTLPTARHRWSAFLAQIICGVLFKVLSMPSLLNDHCVFPNIPYVQQPELSNAAETRRTSKSTRKSLQSSSHIIFILGTNCIPRFVDIYEI